MKLLKTGHHFKVGDKIRFKRRHKEFSDLVGTVPYIVTNIEWTNSLDYCDQFIEINHSETQFYNTFLQPL